MPRGRKPKVKINLQTYLFEQTGINYLAKDANNTWHGFSNHPGILRHKSMWLSIKIAHTSYELKNVDTVELDNLNIYWEQSVIIVQRDKITNVTCTKPEHACDYEGVCITLVTEHDLVRLPITREKQRQQTFAERFNLVGKGVPVHMSQATRDKVQALARESKRIIEAGEDWAKTTNWRFGVTE